MRFAVLQFPGSNCDQDCLHILQEVFKEDAYRVWHKNNSLENAGAVICPGGFSYGDYLRCGAIARFSPIMKAVKAFAESGGLVLGICNGFQILCEMGLLPGGLIRNASLHFRCKPTYVRAETPHSSFTSMIPTGKVLQLPIAHGEGNYICEKNTLREMEHRKQIIFRYADSQGRTSSEANPNGSLENIAGVCNREGNVLGLMPHPERACEEVLGSCDGMGIFQSMQKT